MADQCRFRDIAEFDGCTRPPVAAETRGAGRLKSWTPYNNRYSWMIEVDGGKIKALREYMDSHYVSTIM